MGEKHIETPLEILLGTKLGTTFLTSKLIFLEREKLGN
jgi:hypothetical protein